MNEQKVRVPAYLTVGKIITYAMYIWIVFGIIVLGLRVFLLAFSANASTPFVHFVYTTSSSFLEPFRGIFPPKAVSETGYLDVAAIFAMIIYGLIGWGFAALIHYLQNKIDTYTEAARERERRKREATAAAQTQAAKNNSASMQQRRDIRRV